MAEADVERARMLYGRLIDVTVTRFDDFLDVGPEERADEVSSRLAEKFREQPAAAVMIRLNGHNVGVSTPGKVGEAVGVAGGELGAGDRSSLSGRSTRYRVIRFACRRCDSNAVRSYYDARTIPCCPFHGLMELRA